MKLAYELYNFFHKDKLDYNTNHYKKYNLNKKYYSSISSEDFKDIDEQAIIQEGRQCDLSDIEFYKQQDEQTQKSIEKFDDLGYCTIPNFIDAEVVAKINSEIDELLRNKEIKFRYGNKLMFAIEKSKLLKEIWQEEEFNKFLDYLISGDAKLFQSINFITGSEQETHSDSIHMTTFPLGGLLGVWVALEDVSSENGTIHYYPRSHKLPYYLNRDYDNLGNRFWLGKNGYTAYEEMMEKKILEHDIKKEVFEGKAGDMFIWHANLLHGGEPHTDKSRTRKSMVLHYFDARRICYHEITQRPALMNN